MFLNYSYSTVPHLPPVMNETTPSPSPAPVPTASPDQKRLPALAAGTKRKRTTPGKYYAVKAGFRPGVYLGWDECLAQITGFKGAVCECLSGNLWALFTNVERRIVKAFPTLEDADAFLAGTKLSSGGAPQAERFYGIQRGRVPGVYTDWATAQEQIRGFTRPRYRKFSTREEAEEFVKSGQEQRPPPAVGFGQPQKPRKVSGTVDEVPKDVNGFEYAPGDGPLPPGAEDGFDPNVLLDPKTGKVVYKTATQKAMTKTQSTGMPGMLRIYTDGSSLRNGTDLASAGVGVFFGPGDSRFVLRRCSWVCSF